MIKRELYDEAKNLATLRRMERYQVNRMVEIIHLFNPSYSVCVKCAAQIRHGQRLLLNWLDRVEIIEDVLLSIEPNPEPLLVKEADLELDVDVVEADKMGCQKCGGKRKGRPKKNA